MIKHTAEPLWVDPRAIRFKISPHWDLPPKARGNWDIERRFPLAEAIKHRSIRQRYEQGLGWEDTDMFRDSYSARLARGESIRGASTMQALLEQYYERVDGLFESMKRDGFRLDNGRKNYPLPLLLIGRDGDVFIGNQGNHRLAIVRVLGQRQFAGRVICRHKSWKG